jgi:hypothetical protein
VHLGVTARSWARRFNWNTAAQAQEAFYMEAIESNRDTAKS